MKSIHIEVPCSSANLGCGLDVLAISLNRYLIVDAEYYVQGKESMHPRFELQYLDNHLHNASLDPSSNLIITTFNRFFNLTQGKLRLQIEMQFPLARGLGSSATAILAGVILANWLGDYHWTLQEMLEKSLLIETHADNLAASLFGGLVISCSGSPGITLSFPVNLTHFQLAIVVPNYPGFTKELRSALPKNYALNEVVHSMQRAVALSHFLCNPIMSTTFDRKILANLLDDVLHQTYRSPLIPGFEELKHLYLCQEAPMDQVLGFCLSGSGPSILMFLPKDIKDKSHFELQLKKVYQSLSHPSITETIMAEIYWVQPSSKGAQWTEHVVCASAV